LFFLFVPTGEGVVVIDVGTAVEEFTPEPIGKGVVVIDVVAAVEEFTLEP